MATAAVTGTLDGSTEADVRAGGKTIIITITGDTFVAAGGTFDAQRQAILDGIASDRAEAAGWAAEEPSLGVADVVRTSNTVVTITLDALANYEITGPEKLTVTVPAAALTGAAAVVATGNPTINPLEAAFNEGADEQEQQVAIKHYHGRLRHKVQTDFAAAVKPAITTVFPSGAGTAASGTP